MTPQRVRLGELLLSAQIITRQQLEDVLLLQKTDGRRIGKLLVENAIVTETQVTQILSQQLSVPWVSLYHIDFSRQLLDLVTRELAEKYCLVPIFVRRVRGSKIGRAPCRVRVVRLPVWGWMNQQIYDHAWATTAGRVE